MKIIFNITLGIAGCMLCLNAASQTCIDAIPEDTPFFDFIIHDDGTVTHKKTNLMWKVCAEGQSWDAGACTGTPSIYTWDEALQRPQTLNTSGGYAGHMEWRVPNIKELYSIVELKCTNPAINEEVFPDMVIETAFPYTIPPRFWTSSPIQPGLGMTLSIYFSSGGGDSTRPSSNQVRLVRNAL